MTVVLAYLLGTTVLTAASVTVFDGTQVSPYVPLPTASYYESGTRGQVIYPAWALQEMVGQPINGFTLYINSEGCKMNGGALRVSMGVADTTVFTSETYLTGLTRVALVEMRNGLTEVDFDFDTPYIYNGGNLVVDFYVQSSGEEQGAYNFTYFYGLFQTGHSSLSGGEYREFIPKTTFYYGDLEPVAARVNPRSLAFDAVRVGDSEVKSIYLKNTGSNAFTPAITVAAPFNAVLAQTALQPGEEMEIPVTFEPTSAGMCEGTLIIDCGEGCVLQVPMTGEALMQGQQVDVCDGQDLNNKLPFNGVNYDVVNTFGQMIYPAAELSDVSNTRIVGLQFHTSRPHVLKDATLQLSLMTTDQDEFSTTTPLTGMTAVATVVPVKGEDVIAFELDEPFEYTGGNLAVEVRIIQTKNTYGTTSFYGVNTDYYAGLSGGSYSSERIAFLPTMTVVCQPMPQSVRGDVDSDGTVGIADVTTLIDYILNGEAQGVDVNAADCDMDGVVGIADVTSLIDYILNQVW